VNFRVFFSLLPLCPVSTLCPYTTLFRSVQGFVVRQFVHEGQLIKKGDPVYLIDISKSTRNGIVTDNHRRDIENQLVRVDNIISRDRKSTRLNSSHVSISYAVFCLKKKNI